MRDFWTFIGGVAVGVLAVTGVYAMDDEDTLASVDHDDEELEELEAEDEEITDDDGELVVEGS